MGQITSSIGLISGINTASLIDQLMAIEARPQKLVENNSTQLKSQQVAYQEISAKLLVFKLAADSLANVNTFRATSAASSNPSVLSVTSNSAAVPGSYDFLVNRLVSTQQTISSGFTDRDTTPVAPAGGTLTFEFGDARLESDTSLARLNGGEGVTRGKIRITDRSGAAQIIDLSTALTVNDVLDAINNAGTLSVNATVDGDHFVLEDTSGGAGNLTVANVGSTNTAGGLGLLGSVAANTITGNNINRIGGSTALADLNDGNGVRRLGSQNDFRVTLRDGSTFNVSLGNAESVGDVLDRINTASGGNATAQISADGTGIDIVDATTGGTQTVVTALNGSKAAADLGFMVGDIDGDGTLHGDRVIAGLNSKMLRNLRGGQGVGMTYAVGPKELTGATLLSNLFNGAGIDTTGDVAADMRIKPRNTSTMTNVNIDGNVTVQDLINQLETAP